MATSVGSPFDIGVLVDYLKVVSSTIRFVFLFLGGTITPSPFWW